MKNEETYNEKTKENENTDEKKEDIEKGPDPDSDKSTEEYEQAANCIKLIMICHNLS